MFEVEKAVGNQPIVPAAFQFPTFTETGALLAARSVNSMEDVFHAMRLSPWTDLLVRAGLKDPEWQAKAESSLGRPIDWTAVAVRDATIGPTLKREIERHLQHLP